MPDAVIQVQDLSFRYRADQPLALRGVTLKVRRGARCLLAGANGAGKTTLLRLLHGRHMIDEAAVRVLGRPAFHDTSLAGKVVYLGGNFPFEVDVRVGDMVRHAVCEDRCQRLMRILDVDLDWHMHRVSDGQRRRVQLLLGLLFPYEVLLLDEITTDLDLLGRADLLSFLREESEKREVTILFATHIFERLESWATHLVYLRKGEVGWRGELAALPELIRLRQQGALAPLSQVVEQLLRSEEA